METKTEKQLIEILALLTKLEDEGKDWTAYYHKLHERAFQLEQKIINTKY
jgi:hypothetical protein